MGIGYETEKGSVRGDRGVEEVGQEGSCDIKVERRLLRMEGKGKVGDGEEAGRTVRGNQICTAGNQPRL